MQSDPAPDPTPTRTPRPFAKTEQVLTTVTPAMLAELDAHAVDEQVSRAEAVRTFIRDGLDRAAAEASS